jgi:Sulfotransferase domain
MQQQTPSPYSVGTGKRSTAPRSRFRTRYVSPWKLRAQLLWNGIRWFSRRATAVARPAPTFVIVGAAKAGTTSLLAYLGDHPEIGVSVRKEVRYFDFNYEKSSGWYRAHFPSVVFWLRLRLRTGRWPQVGEATPFYLNYPPAARRIAAFNPRMKVIALLRDPAARAYSHYMHAVRTQREDLSFVEALAAEDTRLANERARAEGDETFVSLARFTQGYLDGSRYAEHLARWLDAFPAEQVLVLEAEALFDRPDDVYAEVAEFLGVSNESLPEYPVRNAAEYDMPHAEWLDEARARLDDDTRSLTQLLGRAFRWTPRA